MRMSCNGCRVLRKGCGEDCSIRPCLEWIKSSHSQANATVFLAKFYGRAGLINLINAGPHHLRPAIFRSLLYEACGRIANPIYGSVGLLWSGSWQLCQAAVEAVLKGEPITPINSDVAESGRGPPYKAFDIRHVSKDESSAALHDVQRPKIKARKRAAKPKVAAAEPEATAGRSGSHDSSISHQSEVEDAAAAMVAESKDSESGVSVEASVLFRDEPESEVKGSRRADGIGLELTLGLEPASRGVHVVPVKKRRIELKDSWGGGSLEKGSCKVELGLECPALT